MGKEPRLNIRITEEQQDILRDRAKAEDVTVTDYVLGRLFEPVTIQQAAPVFDADRFEAGLMKVMKESEKLTAIETRLSSLERKLAVPKGVPGKKNRETLPAAPEEETQPYVPPQAITLSPPVVKPRVPLPEGASKWDVCKCGDYRHQHDGEGCTKCRVHPSGKRCGEFVLATGADRGVQEVATHPSLQKPTAGKKGGFRK